MYNFSLFVSFPAASLAAFAELEGQFHTLI